MSTFDGIVQEFPYIQIDYFRKSPERPPPLACFLSHVHSDHLQGLESFRTPFIYCSAATREILLRIEKYPHRMNFSKGILESRTLHYKHLSKLLRPIPLNSPTEIELTPRLSIRVTLLDANHCSGSVMFLIEGNGKAILYTGDIRAETWWVNSLARHRILIPYTLGNKRLDTIYLDNTFARASHVSNTFPSKAEGISELLRKVATYPEDTTFYFRAWTFGYEEVWIALSAALNSKVHLDRYQLGLYKSLVSRGTDADEAPALCGFELGNQFVPGCLSDDEKSRIHSCEPSVHCSAVPSGKTVYIVPIVNRAKDGSKVPEVGVGGGAGDLYQIHELELPDESTLEQLDRLCLEQIHDPRSLSQTRKIISDAFKSKTKALSLDSYGITDDHEISLENLIRILSRGNSREDLWQSVIQHSSEVHDKPGAPLPRIIHFPYSRHSSYSELCELIAAFKPKNIVPCTVDPFNWGEYVSMQSLFGHLCSGTDFTHDKYMRDLLSNDDGTRSRKRARSDDPHSDHNQSPYGLDDLSTPVATSQKAPAPILSSLETTSDIIPSPKEPLFIPKLSPKTKRVKHSETRQAWDFLNNARSANAFQHLGSLPSSHENEYTPQDPGTPPHPPSSIRNMDLSREDDEVIGDSQISHTFSVSSSAFASQEQIQPENHHSIPRSDIPGDDQANKHNAIRPSLSRTESSRNRKAAYLAARADSFDAWASMSLVSAGNNHTEEEIEL
ncbi:DNA repair protein [Aspergillus steynii IBT 23096]|uniref:Protein artemis n=1 Tax=Aspergillus steynii IBT 23096 TaxID=1392250 RepID=A0A2I2G1D5_9EURO|nr:DNA repair protein [Aspergillus steynii IBT 23096]PLB46692.1 DNA repair protein [Aspergillus steynii IBT 23096]